VVAVLVRESSRVEAGEHLVVIEAMKMQNPVIAERAGTVQKLYVKQGDSVQSGDQLLEMSREE
jgi:biotin carboxyl carrier protein